MASMQIAPISTLLVEPRASDLVSIVSHLSGSCFDVTVANNFAVAKATLAAHPPLLLITELRLGEYNGLHLVLRSKAVRPETAAIVLADAADPVLQDEAAKLGALFVVKPFSKAELIAAALRLTLGTSGHLIVPPFERRHQVRRAAAGIVAAAERRHGERRRPVVAALSN
jgi:two-component system response regulator RegA